MAREKATRRPCCLISEVLEETGLDREKVRRLRKQILQGIILLCQWQLERMHEPSSTPPPATRRRKVDVQ